MASSSSSSTPNLWDVFLSFRGTDTRNGFTSHLHNSLQRHTGIRTFIDETGLQGGDVISPRLRDAIKKSKLYIVILSKNYASSGWCLDELVEILECSKLFRRLVLPIFYKIEPSVVRHQIESFKQAFEKHEGRVAMDLVKKWRGALKEVANFSGYHVRDEDNLCIEVTDHAASGHEHCQNRHLKTEAEIINEVVERALLEINPATLEVARYPVGIDSRVADIQSLLCSGTSNINGVHWIGIHGMGGVGKTTLAKAFYNQMFLNYEGSCFLADVKDICAGLKCHVCLQKQLIDDVLKRKNTATINNIDRGINLIAERISSLKVLVVLDDIDHQDQVDYLVRNFVVGSVIILTTRNEDLLQTLGVKARYRVNVLDSAQSLELFKRHAFGYTEIKDEFMEMSKEILQHAGGLPLALTLLGSSLKYKSKDRWRFFIEELLQVPINDVEKSLRISFDALILVNSKLQAFFLDVACFFIRKKRDDAVKILETCYNFVNDYIIMLEERCFITINEKNQLSMHNLLSGMGRKIAGNSRLFLDEDIRDVLQNNKGTEAIEDIVDWDNTSFYSIDVETFNTMPNLRFLRLCWVKNIRGTFDKRFKDLTWLCWYNCDSFPSNFSAEKLVILELQWNRIRRFAEKALVLGKLKILDMWGSYELSNTPDFNGLPCLETLNLSGCSSLVEVDVSIGNLEWLITLDLNYCLSLRSLPESICKLRALKSLNIDYCRSLEALPMELGNIESLTHLYAAQLCIPQLPNSLGRLSKLVMLDLRHNSYLQSIPDTICNLRSLKDLYLTGCSSLKALPMELGNIESLTHLDADGLSISLLWGSLGRMIVLELDKLNFEAYDFLQSILNMRSVESLYISCCHSTQLANLQLPSTLKQLKAYNCLSLLKLSDLYSNLQQLEKMHISQCSSLREMEGLDKLISIKKLHLKGCTSLKRLPDLSNLQQLEKIYLSYCSSLTEIEGLEKLNSLKKLRLEKLILVKVLRLQGCTSMKTLHLEGCSNLTEIEGLEDVLSINELDLSGCISLNRLPNLSNLQKLKTLYLTGCSSLTEIQGLGEAVDITRLICGGCKVMERLPNLSKLKQLEILHLSNCMSLTEIQGLEEVISLTQLDLRGCISLYSLPDLSKLQKLEYLWLANCSRLTEIQGFGKLISIEELHLEGCTSMDRLPDLSGLQNLKSLRLKGSSSLREMEGLGKLISIEELHLEGCTSMNRLPDLSGLQNLKSLRLKGSSSLREMEGLGKLISIEELNLEGCTSMNRLPDLSGLQNLKSLRLMGSSNLREMEGLGKLISIEELNLEGCTSMNRLPDLSGLQNLKSLRLKGSSSLREMEGLGKLISIEELNLEGCTSMNRLPDLSGLQNLKSLRLMGSSNLREMEGLEDVLSLTIINLSGCISLKRFPNLSNLQQLQTLRLTNCSQLTGIEGLEEVISLTLLHLRGCTSLYSLPDLSKLQKLWTLELMDCSSLTEIQGLEEVISLTLLDLRGCTSLYSLPDLSKLQKLRTLELMDCSSLTEIQGLGEVVDIVRLNCGGCKAMERLPNLSKLQQLKILQLSDCINLTEIQGLEEVISLTKLDLRGCTSLSSLPDLSNLQKLEFLWLANCSRLTEIESVERLISIRELHLGGCRLIKRLPNLSNMKKIKSLHVTGCSSLTEIQGLEKLSSITELDFRGCTMKRVPYVSMPPISIISLTVAGAAASSSGLPDRAVPEDAKDKSKVWQVIEVNEPSLCLSTKLPDNMRVTRLIYTDSGNAILALASNGIHFLSRWQGNYRNSFGMATASVSPQLWQPSGSFLMTNEVTEDALSCFALSNNGRFLISASGGSISIFDMITFKMVNTFKYSAATFFAFHPQDNIIAIGLDDSSIAIHIKVVHTFKYISKLKGHFKRITGLAFSKVLNVLVSSGADAQLCVWSSNGWDKQNARYLQLPDGTIPNVDSDTHVQFHLDQIQFLVVHETQLAIYETEKLECFQQWVPRESAAPITHATFSCDSKLIYACFLDASLCVFTATDLSIRSRISPTAYLPPSVSTSSVHPLVIAAHPKEPNQIAVGLSDGGVCVFEPLESEDVPPPLENGSASSVPTTTADGGSCSDQAVRPPVIATYHSRTKQIKELKTYQRRGKKRKYEDSTIVGRDQWS